MDKESIESYTGIHSLPENATSILEDIKEYEENCIPVDSLEKDHRHNSVTDSWLRIFDKAEILRYKNEYIYK